MASLFGIPGLSVNSFGSSGAQSMPAFSFGTSQDLPGAIIPQANLWNSVNQIQSGSGSVLGTGTTKMTGGGNKNSGGSGGGSGSSNTNLADLSQYNIPSGPTDQQLNDMFAGAYASLGAQEQSLRNQLPLDISQVQQAGDSAKTQYQQMLDKGLAQYGQQEQGSRTESQNAMAQARQLYNELSQSQMARFGTGTSAGPAAMELLGRSTQQQFGNVQNALTQNLQKLDQARRDLQTFVADKTTEVAKNVDLQVQQINKWYQDQLNSIAASKTGLESDKAAKRYDALKAREDFIREIQNRAIDYTQQLNVWKQQQDYANSQAMSGYGYQNVTPDNLIAQAQKYQQGLPSATSGFQSASPNFIQNSTYLGGKQDLTPEQLAQLQMMGLSS